MNTDHELLAVFKAEVEDQIDELCQRLGSRPNRWKVDKLFQLSHNVKGAARVVGVDSVRDAAHALEDLFGAIRDGLDPSDQVVATAREGAELLEACFHAMDSGQAPEVGAYRRKVSEQIGGQPSGEGEPTPAAEVETVPDAEQVAQPEVEEAAAPGKGETLRIGIEKLDALMGMTSEVIAEVYRAEERSELANRLNGRLASLIKRRPDLKAEDGVAELVRLARELRQRLGDGTANAARVSEQLQDSVRRLRMVRVDSVSSLLNRSLREACRFSHNRAELVVEGGETEVDRAVLDHLRDPLIHIVRNAAAHGIEPPDERRAAGKPEVGAIRLLARSAGAWVEIVVTDDGRGIDPELVRQRAVETGATTAAEAAALDDGSVFGLLVRPGFSTARTVTELAGRGVGLDVVACNMATLGGSATIDSAVGSGTSIVLRVPLTRLTTKGIVVRLGAQCFAAPIVDVQRTLTVSRSQIANADGVEVVAVDGSLVPVSHLGALLGLPVAGTEVLPAIVIGDGHWRRVLLVDEVVGEREFIVQPLAWNLEGASGLAGASVMDRGRVVLVLDSRTLVHGDGTTSGASAALVAIEAARRHRLLVVDDSVTSRTLEKNILSAAGYDVLVAVEGSEAWRLIEKQDVDLAIIDIRMAGMDGLELTRLIRSTPSTRELPVVLVTGLGSEADRRRGAEAGADAYIVKGEFDQDELLRTVARLL